MINTVNIIIILQHQQHLFLRTHAIHHHVGQMHVVKMDSARACLNTMETHMSHAVQSALEAKNAPEIRLVLEISVGILVQEFVVRTQNVM